MRFKKLFLLVLSIGVLVAYRGVGKNLESETYLRTKNQHVEALEKAQRFVKEIKEWLGVPYSLGTTSKEKGIDCSRHSRVVYQALSKDIGIPSGEQMKRLRNWGRLESLDSIEELEFGDIIFHEYASFKTGSVANFPLTRHVRIYLWEGYVTHVENLDGVTLEKYPEDWFKKNGLYRGRVINDFKYLSDREKKQYLQDLLQYMEDNIQPRIDKEKLQERDFSDVDRDRIFRLAKKASSKTLSEDELNSLSPYELLLLRNGIYANHNLPFEARDLRKFFIYYWSGENSRYVPSWWLYEKHPLNAKEIQNVNRITQWESVEESSNPLPVTEEKKGEENQGNAEYSKDIVTLAQEGRYRHLTQAELQSLNLKDLRLLRNAFYAFYNRPFNNKWIEGYFKQHLPGYTPDTNCWNPVLSPIEMRNVVFIKGVEDSR